MINPTELRIGNLIQDETGKIHKVQTLNNYSNQGINEDFFEGEYFGIPIDEGALKRLGFQMVDKKTYYLEAWKAEAKNYGDDDEARECSIKAKANGDTFVAMLVDDQGWIISKEIYHVHQIQNMYFAVTGEELTIKNG